MTGADEVLIAVRRGDEFLVLLRSPEKRGYWHLAGGRVEEGESDADAAARELLEETELAAATLEDLGDDLGYNGRSVHAFATEAPPGWEPILNEEHDSLRWCCLDDALELLRYEEPREVLRRAAVLYGVSGA
jgi:8-oxo-dGTP pyrophosphatase MutT (NUDIX family)